MCDPDERGKIRQALLQHLVGDAQGLHLIDEGFVLRADTRQSDAGTSLGLTQPHLLGQQLSHHIRPHFVVLIDALKHGCGVFDPESPVKALREFPVVDPDVHRRQPHVPM